jgi:GntR family transcriptional regulator, transcriptional repressor for pyruvate dehydrogenase complex
VARECRTNAKARKRGSIDTFQAGQAVVGASVFEPVGKRKTTSQFVLGQIISLLGEGKLRPGDRLPTERDLATLLGVGRPSLREALSALALLGIIEQKQGRGTFLVDRIDRLPVEPYLYQLMLAKERIFDDLIEVRELLEPAIAALAAERGTEADLDEIRRSLELFELEVERGADLDSEAVAGADFHQTLAQATGNQTLARLIESLRDLLSATGHVLGEYERGASLEAYRALAKAVLNRDAGLAESLMRKHLDDVSNRLSVARKRSLGTTAKRPRTRSQEGASNRPEQALP